MTPLTKNGAPLRVKYAPPDGGLATAVTTGGGAQEDACWSAAAITGSLGPMLHTGEAQGV